MQGTIYVGGWIRVVIYVQHEGSIMQLPCDYTGNSISSPTAAQLLELLTNFWSFLGAAWAAQHANSYSVLQLTATDMSAAGRATATYVPTVNTTGTKAGDALPANCALVATWRSGLTGRSHRGRTYFFGFQEQDSIGSFITSGAITTLGTLVSDILNFTNGTGAVIVHKVIVSRTLRVLTNTTAFFIDNAFDSQRRRLPLRGQ